VRSLLVLPRRLEQPVLFKPAQGRIDGAARKARLIDDVEPVLIAIGDGLQYANGVDAETSYGYADILHSL
jgi:hypothetical protein